MDLKNIKRNVHDLRRIPNVVGGGIGKRIKNNAISDEDVMHVFVKEKLALENLNPRHVIPPTIWNEGSEETTATDVIAVGNIQKLSNRDTTRPILGGLSVSNPLDASIGTLAVILNDNTDSTPVLMSNNHVFARENAASIGEDIVQPGPGDDTGGGKVAEVKRFVAINFGPGVNHIDGALASVETPTANDIDLGITNIGQPRGLELNPVPDLLVQKSGRTSEHTFGTVISTNATVFVSYDTGTAEFEDQIVTTHMLQSGDSGSLLLTVRNEVVGLGYAGSEDVSVFSPIADVMTELDVSFYEYPVIVNYKDPIRGGFFYREDDDPDHDPQYVLNNGTFFLLFPTTVDTSSTSELKRWKTTTFPVKYALATSSPGIVYTEDITLGRIGDTELVDTVALKEWIDSANNRFYTTDPAGGGIDTDRFVEQPLAVGWVVKIETDQPII